jgi:hypothetical protein
LVLSLAVIWQRLGRCKPGGKIDVLSGETGIGNIFYPKVVGRHDDFIEVAYSLALWRR